MQQLKRTLKGQLKVDKIPEDLLMEKAVMEVVRIRKLILNWQAKYRDDHGHKPDLETTKAVAPQIYDLVVQFASLQDYVRNGDRWVISSHLQIGRERTHFSVKHVGPFDFFCVLSIDNGLGGQKTRELAIE